MHETVEKVNVDVPVIELSECEQVDIQEGTVKEVAIARPINENNFVIVLATCVAEKNAMELIEKMENDGYSDVVFDKSGKMNRVTYSSYPTFKEASEDLSFLRNLSPHFKEAWVYNRK